MKKILTLCLITCFFVSMRAQKEANNWVFGYGAGLTWNTTRDILLTGVAGTANATLSGLPSLFTSSISTLEGCFSLSDSNGNLLFYSDGRNVWNRNHVIMLNGTNPPLTGHDSSAQSGIILPYPGNPDKYIAVTLGQSSANNLSYSVIDMTADGGLGAVVLSQKNILFTGAKGTTGESVTSILHANEKDYWVVAPGRGTPTYFNSWLIKSTGIASTLVTVQLPFDISASTSNGYFKFTPDGKHFVWATFSGSVVFYGDFDNTTGVFSNIRRITGYSNPYGVEFSPSMKYLYLKDSNYLYVYDFVALLAASDPTTVVPKKYTITGTIHSALQLGPDGRIYLSAHNQNYLCIIDNPDDYNSLKVYQLPMGTAKCGLGLPSFAASWFNAKGVDKSFVCTDNSSNFIIEISSSSGTSVPSQLKWNFGDGTAIVTQPFESGTTTYKQPHKYVAKGKYTITVTPYKSDGTPLSQVTIPVNIVDCNIKTNRMIREDLLNTAQQQ